MKKIILISGILALLAGGCGRTGQKQKSDTATEENLPVEIEKNQAKRKVKHFFTHSGDNAVCFADGTAYSCYDYVNYENYERGGNTSTIDTDDEIFRTGYYTIEPDYCSPYKEYANCLLTKDDHKWDLFDDFGHIVEGWQVINYCRINSRMQITNFEEETANIPAKDIQAIKETCLILIVPEYVDQWEWFKDDREKEYAEKGIPSVDAQKRYLSFTLDGGEKITVDTKKKQNGTVLPPSALLYRKGYIPIMLSISGENDEGNRMIEEYLR
jgi:hypothetical protein